MEAKNVTLGQLAGLTDLVVVGHEARIDRGAGSADAGPELVRQGPDRLAELVLEAGGDDLQQEGEQFEIHCPPETFSTVQQMLEGAQIEVHESSIVMEPQNVVHLDGKKAEQCLRLLEILEDHDDVQNVYANLEVDDEFVDSGAD